MAAAQEARLVNTSQPRVWSSRWSNASRATMPTRTWARSTVMANWPVETNGSVIFRGTCSPSQIERETISTAVPAPAGTVAGAVLYPFGGGGFGRVEL